jgi:DNA-binding HxlR family transcriptional regulator
MAQAGARTELASEEQAAAEVLRMLGRRWTFLILYNLENGGMRFNELKKSLAGITSTVLSDRLLELEREGLVAKNVIQGKIEYSLTTSARELQVMLREMGRWRARRILLSVSDILLYDRIENSIGRGLTA